jgi:two-component system, OmpR family, sensor histidine kinase KdpD
MMRPAWQRWALGAIALAATTLALLAFRDRLDKAHVTLAYLLMILLASVSGGRRLGLTLAATAFLLFNWFFLRPYGTFRVNDPLDWSILVIFIAVSAIAAQMLHWLQQEAVVARQRADEVNQFAVLGAETLNMARAEDALRAVAETIRANLHVARCQIHAAIEGDAGSSDQLLTWVLRNGRAALRFADGTTHIAAGSEPFDEALPATRVVSWLLPLAVRDQVVGVLDLSDADGIRIGTGERRFLRALSYYAALGIERARLASVADHADALREADRMKDALLASVSHDLRTPLTTIKALAHELAGSDTRAIVIEEEADRLNRLVADLLDLSRIQGNALPLHAVLNAVDDLVGALVQRVSGLLGTRPLRIELPADSTLLVGRFDFVHALRILVNLVENAHKYSPTGSPITLRVLRDGCWLHFAVADLGPGVPEAERNRIFEPFYRPAAAIADSRSAGLGLAISRHLAELQGGALSYAPASGGGSEFLLTLPAADLPEDAIES